MQCTYEVGRAGVIHPSGPTREQRLGSRLVAVPLFYTPQSAWPPDWWHSETPSLLCEAGCLGTRMDHAVPQMSARQSMVTPSRPGVGEGRPGWQCGARSQHSPTAPLMLHPSLKRASHNLVAHAGHPQRPADEPGTGQVGRAISVGLGPFQSRHGSDPRRASGRHCSPFWSP